MSHFEIRGGRPEPTRENLHDIILAMAIPYGERAHFSREATETYVREKLKRMPPGMKPYDMAKWARDNCCAALLNESFGP